MTLVQIGKITPITRPTLQFNQAQDMVLVGQMNIGVNKTFVLVREIPTHLDFASWVSTLRELLLAQTDLNSPQLTRALEPQCLGNSAFEKRAERSG